MKTPSVPSASMALWSLLPLFRTFFPSKLPQKCVSALPLSSFPLSDLGYVLPDLRPLFSPPRPLRTSLSLGIKPSVTGAGKAALGDDFKRSGCGSALEEGPLWSLGLCLPLAQCGSCKTGLCGEEMEERRLTPEVGHRATVLVPHWPYFICFLLSSGRSTWSPHICPG